MARCCQCLQSPETKGHMYGQKQKGHVSILLAIGVLSMSLKSGEKRSYIWGKGKRTSVLLGSGGQEREIQSAQVNFIKGQRQKNKKVICRSASSVEAHA